MLTIFKTILTQKPLFSPQNSFYANIFFLILFLRLFSPIKPVVLCDEVLWKQQSAAIQVPLIQRTKFHCLAFWWCVFTECFCLQNSFLKPLSHACSRTLPSMPLFEADIKTVLPDISFVPIVYLLPLKSHNLCISVQMCSRFMRLESSKPSQQQFWRWRWS